MILQFRAFFTGRIFLSISLGIPNSSVDFGGGHVGALCDRDLLMFAGAKVFGRYIYNAIGINRKSDLDLWNAAQCAPDPRQTETAQRTVITGNLPLTLQNMNVHTGLEIGGSGEYLASLYG